MEGLLKDQVGGTFKASPSFYTQETDLKNPSELHTRPEGS